MHLCIFKFNAFLYILCSWGLDYPDRSRPLRRVEGWGHDNFSLKLTNKKNIIIKNN